MSNKNYKEREELIFDNWQKKVLNHEGNITLRCGRQVGKSTVVARKAYEFATRNPETTTLVIAAGLRQSSLLFEKIRAWFDEDDEYKLKRAFSRVDLLGLTRVQKRELELDASIYTREPTKTRIELKNGSVIHCVPTGKTGAFIRGFAIDMLVADEAAYIPEMVWVAVIPMLATSKKLRGFGWVIMLSTPFGKGGYYYQSFHDKDFLHIHIKSEQCKRISKSFLSKEKRRISRLEYAQEYLGEFVDEYHQFFSTKLIKECSTFMEWNYAKDYNRSKSYYLGVDVARYGGDENAFVVAELHQRMIKIIKVFTTERRSLTDTVGRIKVWHEKFRFKRIFIDDAGVGAGVTDSLIESFGRKVVGLNNASRSVDKDGKHGRILKQDLYSNLLVMMEHYPRRQKPWVEMIHDVKLIGSLKNCQFEYTEKGKFRIFGKKTHVAEAVVRACWCIKEKGLNLFATSF